MSAAQERPDLLTPVTKAWCTDIGCEVASLGVQVHGGMGFIEETGAAQHYRDARILPIYEGTNGIQALDLLGRKLLRDNGRGRRLGDRRGCTPPANALKCGRGRPPATTCPGPVAASLERGLDELETATHWLLEQEPKPDIEEAAAGATPYLRLFGTVAGGWLHGPHGGGRPQASAQRAGPMATPASWKAKIATARFYADNVLPQRPARPGPGCRSTLVTEDQGSASA